MASYESTTSVARTQAAARASEPSPDCCAASHWRSAARESRSTLTPRSSRPFRRMLATEFRCAMQETRRFLSSQYSGDCCKTWGWLACLPSKSCSRSSCATAWTISLRAFSSMPISSAMYLCSKLAQAKSMATRALRNSDRVGLPLPRGVLGLPHCSSRAMSSDQARWRALARRMASTLNSNLSPLTQIAAYCSTLASRTSTR
mmetsp:Transcript_79774/g.220613  ORF Transcript_79774/g.220613 Transcript_79774/m.220613 type:complete len:203 (-) Transcript_79774:348-956(-)